MRQAYEAVNDRARLLDRIKYQYEGGAMRPRLYEVFESEGATLPTPTYEWMFYAGMGNLDLMAISPRETEAVQELLGNGQIVPTFEEDFFGVKKIRLIQHFDDVRFGMDEKGEILIYEFSPTTEPPLPPDPVIRPDGRHDAAIKRIRERMNNPLFEHNIVVDDRLFQLNEGPVLKPLITNEHEIRLKERQRAFNL